MKKILVLSYFSFTISYLSFGQNVGIGTTSPASKLHVKGTGGGNQIVLEESTGIMLRISNEASAIGPYIGTTSNHSLTLVSNNAGRMTVATSGNIGIGTTSPQQQLSVAGGVVIDQNNNNTGTSVSMLSFGSSSGEGIGSKRTSGINQYGLDFYTNSLNRMTITLGGGIGIGTTTPTQKLDINGAIKIGTTSTTSDGSIRYNANKFEGYNGTNWASFEQLPKGTIVCSSLYPDNALIDVGYSYKGFIDNIKQINTTTGVGANSWAPTSTEAPINPGARYDHTAVWTGSQMIIWGGKYNFSTPTINGVAYNPVNNSWQFISIQNQPSTRYRHTAIWTGTEMIIWGGGTNTGAKYNPSTNTWADITITGAPSSRFFHTAIWTGTEMVVWGGSDDNDITLSTGAKYNPTTNTWTTITNTNAPIARSSHTAVWTGTEMIIWGGRASYAFGDFLNDGKKYNPVTNVWTNIIQTGSPSPRLSNTAVWNGADMIIWGGSEAYPPNDLVATNTGAKYNPITNIWSSVSTANAPGPITNHTAIADGANMYLWGGDNGLTAVNYVGYTDMYKFNGTSWSKLTSTNGNQPIARSSHTMVNAGNQLIIWGGETNITLNTGARFFPFADANYQTSTESTSKIYLYSKD